MHHHIHPSKQPMGHDQGPHLTNEDAESPEGYTTLLMVTHLIRDGTRRQAQQPVATPQTPHVPLQHCCSLEHPLNPIKARIISLLICL